MKILFIGGTGRLSKDAAEYACSFAENEVFMLNRGNKAKSEVLEEKSKSIVADIRNSEEVKQKLEGRMFDVIVDFLTYNKKQMEGTLSALEGHYKQYVFISSATVYKKESEKEIISEATTKVGNDKWKYARNKVVCEAYLKEYWTEKKLAEADVHYTIIRPYVTYGNTRFPYALVPREGGEFDYSLLWRIRNKKVIPLYDGGIAKGTIMNTKDFAFYLVGVFGNVRAYDAEFHITSDEVLQWKEVIETIIRASQTECDLIDIPTSCIEEILQEYKGVLSGDKATNMIFDNSKIKAVTGIKGDEISFAEGIKETVAYYDSKQNEHNINYKWDGRLDYLVAKWCKQNHVSAKKYNLKCMAKGMHNKLYYYCGRYPMVNKLYLLKQKHFRF